MVRSRENLIAAWAFLVGVILAILVGIFADQLDSARSLFYIALVVLGLVVGYLIVEDKNSTSFLIASVSLVIVGGLGNNSLMFISNLSPILTYLVKVLAALLVLFIPATIIAALKSVFSLTTV
jgi:uncharacterized membrane protein YiaA